MHRADYHSYNTRLLPCVALLLGFCGCAYQAQLLDRRQIEPDAGVIVRCSVVKEPVINVSESGDFVFRAAGGPGPATYAAAHIINKSNNDRYRKMLKPALQVDYFCERFEENLKKAIEENDLRVEQITIEYENAGILDMLGPRSEKDDHKYVLQLKISCGLFKSEAQAIARIEGKLIRLDNNKVVWKNKLNFEGQAAAEHKHFGDGKKAIEQWKKDNIALRDCLIEVVQGVTNLLALEFGEAPVKRRHELTKLKLKNGKKIKGSIIDESQQRLVVRLKGGEVRSMLTENVLSVDPQYSGRRPAHALDSSAASANQSIIEE